MFLKKPSEPVHVDCRSGALQGVFRELRSRLG